MEKTILIVDDDTRNIFALSAILKAKGYKTLTATTMDEAFEHLKEPENIGLILIDMMMPNMDGYEAIPLIKKDTRLTGVPVIAVTAQAMKGDKEKCLAAGADGYIPKPVDIDQLLALLKKASA